jgi:hypothetical protein
VFDEARGSHYTIWAVAFLLYASDAAKLLVMRELLLVEAGRGRFGALFSENPFTLAGRVLTFAPLLGPHRGVFVAPWGSAWIDERALKAILEPVERLRGSLSFARILATWAFILLFVLGPAFTFLLGPGTAVLYTAVLLYPTAVVAIVWLWWCRRDLRLTAAQSAGVSIELVVCPAFLPNLVRKITSRTRIDVDAAQALAATASPEARDAFFAKLESRTGELIEETSDDQTEQAHLRRYLATVRGAS